MIEGFLSSKNEIHIIDSGIDYLKSQSFKLKKDDKEKIEFVSKMARDNQPFLESRPV